MKITTSKSHQYDATTFSQPITIVPHDTSFGVLAAGEVDEEQMAAGEFEPNDDPAAYISIFGKRIWHEDLVFLFKILGFFLAMMSLLFILQKYF